MATIRLVINPEQHLKSEAPGPEPLRCLQVMTGPGNTQMTRRNGFHGPIIAEPDDRSPAPSRPASSQLQLTPPSCKDSPLPHGPRRGLGCWRSLRAQGCFTRMARVYSRSKPWRCTFCCDLDPGCGDDSDVAAHRRGIGEPGREQRGLDAPVSVGGRGRGAGELRDTFGQVEAGAAGHDPIVQRGVAHDAGRCEIPLGPLDDLAGNSSCQGTPWVSGCATPSIWTSSQDLNSSSPLQPVPPPIGPG